ncbi:hypothetical protein 2 [Wenzhou picorna-like virus 20]|uniref:hypothetical protein 2 n=1 Tax=Wenzhou picorna-like virus 20 TaxID=1923605 RepID=UPI00090CB9A5|nr:hypothetical protein 2 [Wenzhou picorna-like virus 20]APG78551.1 hypothetical protein 2 [Wenzhou picorna-like virus 20]
MADVPSRAEIICVATNNQDISGGVTENKEDDSVEISESVEIQQTEQTVTYITARDQYGVDVTNDLSAYDDGLSDPVPLGNSLERPVKLTEFTWTYNTSLRNDIDIWTLWQSDPFIKSKLDNFAYLRCNLNIKIVCSASPFHYGRLMFNYIPYGDSNEVWYNNKTTLYGSGAAGSIEAYLQYLSTYPITGFIDPGSNNVVNLKIPFLWHKNFINIAGIDGTAKESLGLLTYTDLNILSKANPNATDTVNVSVFCWASDISLQMPTNFSPTSSGKSKMRKRVRISSDGVNEVDDCSEGVISTPATAIANIAGKLSNVPVIGKFAKATEIGASAVGNVAKLFGFSNPPMNITPIPRSLRMYRNLANVIGQDTAEKMSLDPNQELTIDPRVIGWSPNDDMTISSIVSKEQWLTKGQWNKDVGQFVTAGATKIVAAVLVSPVATRATAPWGAAPVRTAVQPSPSGHLAHLFKYWRGKIIYRIEVVASKYHSGALQIQFDPMVKSAALAAGDFYTANTNTRQTVVLDITETKELEIEIDYVSHAPFLKCRDIVNTTFAPGSISDTTFALDTVHLETHDLGVLTISVLNELVAPGDTSVSVGAGAGVDVNVYMKCADDLVFAQPTGGWEGDIFVPTSSGLTTWQKKVLIEAEDTADDVLTFFGEKVSSVRSLLKRPVVTHMNVPITGAFGGGSEQVRMYFPHFTAEVLRGAPDSRRNSYESYLAPCFLAKRGGMRYKIYFSQSNTTNATTTSGYAAISRGSSDATVAGNPTVTLADNPSRNSILSAFPSGAQGMQLTEVSYNPTLDIEAPFYSSTRFNLACDLTNLTSPYNLTKNTTMDEILYVRVDMYGFNAGSWKYTIHNSVGEDYSLMCFQAPPTHWIFS